MVSDDLQRSELLYGPEAMERLAHSRVIVFGVGGVGSWCAEALLRTGVGHLVLVDADTVDVSNINRQLPATVHTLGQPKAEVLRKRFLDIRPDADVRAIQAFYDAETAEDYALDGYDVVIDAIDSVASKADLILRASGIPTLRIFSSMGAAMRTDPSKVTEAEFWHVRGCPLARALRDRFKRQGIKPRRRLTCVYSEEPLKGAPKGTSMAVTATFGLHLASLAINYLVSQPTEAPEGVASR